MQSHNEQEEAQLQTLLTICERIHQETQKACPYSSNRHPELGYMGNNHFSKPQNLLRAAMRSRKRNLFQMMLDGKTVEIPAKEFVLKHMNIDIHRFAKDENDDSLMSELNRQVLKLTNVKLCLWNLEEVLGKSNIVDKKFRKDPLRPYTEKHAYEAFAKNLHRFHVGNCSDRAKYNIVAAMELPAAICDLNTVKANPKGISIEYFGLNGDFNHSFVVVNRDLNSDPGKPQTWGKHSIIIDSWWNLHNETTNQGVFVVADELKKLGTEEESSLFRYIMQAEQQGQISNYGGPAYYLGEGHTKEWQDKVEAGKRPPSLCDYSDLTKDAEANIQHTTKPK